MSINCREVLEISESADIFALVVRKGFISLRIVDELEAKMKLLVVSINNKTLDHLVVQARNSEGKPEVKEAASLSLAEEVLRKEVFNIVMLELDADGKGTIDVRQVVQRFRDIQPDLYVVVVTQHVLLALDSFKARANAFLLKPVFITDLNSELEYYLKHYSIQMPKKVIVKTFGNFDVFVDGIPLVFQRSKSKELLAYLIDRRGCFVTNRQAIGVLWEERPHDQSLDSMYRTVLASLTNSLKAFGIDWILIKNRNNVAVDTTKFYCDYYQILKDGDGKNTFTGEYMLNYSWAENTAAALQNLFIE